MSTTLKALARGSFGTSSATLYTVPSSTTAVLSNVSICNTTDSSVNFFILLDGVELFSTTAIAAYTTVVIDIKQALAATKLIAGYASASGVRYHLSGAEIS
jgi:hypothetical protein